MITIIDDYGKEYNVTDLKRFKKTPDRLPFQEWKRETIVYTRKMVTGSGLLSRFMIK